MKRLNPLSLRRKTLLRAVQAAMLALVLWVEGPRQASAQTFTAPFDVSGSTVTTTAGTYSGNTIGFYDPNNPYTLTLGAGTSVTNNSATGYGSGVGTQASPYAIVTAGGGTFINHGSLILGSSNSPVMATGSGTFAALALGNSGSASVNNFGTLSCVVSNSSTYENIVASGLSFYSSAAGSLTLTNQSGATISGTASGAYGTGYGIDAASTNGTALTIINQGNALGTGTGTGLGYLPSSSGTGTGAGIEASSTNGGAVTITNTGTVVGTGTGNILDTDWEAGGIGTGINATSYSSSSSTNAGTLVVFNSGSASGTGTGNGNTLGGGYGEGIGINATASGYATGNAVTVINQGTALGTAIGSQSGYTSAGGIGICAISTAFDASGAVTVINSGSASGVAYASTFRTAGVYAAGIEANSLSSSNTGALTVINSGAVSGGATADTTGYYYYSPVGTGYGIDAFVEATSGTAGALSVVNSGVAYGTGSASGVSILGINGAGTGTGYGIYADSVSTSTKSGAVSVVNRGTVSAVGTGTGSTASTGTGYGIYANSTVNTLSSLSVTNTGTVTASGTTASYGIYLGSIGTVYNTGTVTGGTAAISVPGGSSVTLAGYSVVNGLIQGGSSASSISQIHFNLTLPQANLSAAQASVAAAQANLAADNTAGIADTVLINGQTYRFLYFGFITDSFVVVTPQETFAQNFSQVASANSPLSGMAHSLSTLPSGNAATGLLTTLNALPMTQIGTALNQLTPSKTSSATTSAITSNTTFENSRLNARLEQVNNGLAASGMDWSGLSVASADDPLLGQLSGQLYAYNPSEAAETPTMSDTLDRLINDDVVEGPRWGSFLTGNAILANQDATATQARVDSTTVGVTGGIDYRIDPHWTAGLYLGYGRTTANLDGFGSRSEINDYRMGPYAGYHNGNWWSNAHASFGLNQEENARAIPFLGTVASSHPDGTQYDAGIDGGYDFHYGKLTYGPTAGLQYTHLNVNGYTETGAGAADLTVDSQQADSLLASLGAQVSYDIHWTATNTTFRPQINAAWQHECLNNSTALGAAFAVPGSASFTTPVPNEEKDSALVGGAANLIFSGGSLLFVQYEAQAQPDYLAQSITGGMRIPF